MKARLLHCNTTRKRPALSRSNGPALSRSNGPALSRSNGPVLSRSKEPALSRSKWPALSRSKGFTVIELLVVIGILLILIALFVGGLKHVTMQAKQRDTKTMLGIAVTMLENYKQDTHFGRTPPTGVLLTDNEAGNTTPSYWTSAQVEAPGSITPDLFQYGTTSYTTWPVAVRNTAYVMYVLESIPENKTILTNIPASKIMNVYITINKARVSVPLLLDAWGNPILFVPGGGLGLSSNTSSAAFYVWLDAVNYGTVTSTGIITNSSTPNLTNYAPYPPTPGVNSANQPFFVSAGPDGDVSNAHGNTTTSNPTSDMTDDNLYSFQN